MYYTFFIFLKNTEQTEREKVMDNGINSCLIPIHRLKGIKR